MTDHEQVTLYLGDMVHNYLGSGSYMFPLNIGYIAAYTGKLFGDRVAISLYKYPEELMKAIQRTPPDILGLSNYTWNAHINGEIARATKALSPNTMVIFGGPDINLIPQGYADFFRKRPSVDFYVLCEGEKGFTGILQRYFSLGGDIAGCKEEPLEGVVFMRDGKPTAGPLLARIKKPDEVPSPYLTGLLDKFFEYRLIPIIETNRGCPFSCTFCAQGLTSRHRVTYFSLDRVMDELDYIAGRVRHTNLLCIADANFGIHDRDVVIGRKIRSLGESKGYPRRCIINWIKTRKSIEVADIMGEAAYLISSLQSMDPVVQKHIKRSNIEPSLFREIIDHVNSRGGISGTEIILGLPGETKESHANNLRELFRWGVSYIICYNALLIGGSELSLPEQRDRFRITTKFRLIDSAFGKYGGILSFEAEEGIRSTSTISEDEILFFRPVHWLIQFCWNYRAYYDLLKLVLSEGTSPYDFLVYLVEHVGTAPARVRGIFEDFRKEAEEEWFETPEALIRHYSEKKNFDDLAAGAVGKMNSKYTWRVMLECKPDFDSYIESVAQTLLPGRSRDLIRDLVRFDSNCLIDFGGGEIPLNGSRLHFSHDIMAWREQGYSGLPQKRGLIYDFFLPPEKKDALNVLLDQYRHTNRNVTMRKMSEHMRFDDLYYTIREIS